MKVKVLPQTSLGIWGLGAILLFGLIFLIRATTEIFLPIPSFLIFGIGILGLVLLVIDFLQGGRSLLVLIIGIPIAVFMLFWIVGEIVFPH